MSGCDFYVRLCVFPDAGGLLERAEGHELEMICKCIFNQFDCENMQISRPESDSGRGPID